MKRSEGEVLRARVRVRDLRAMLDSVEYDLVDPNPLGPGTAQTLVHAAADLAMVLARLDAYRRAEAGLEIEEEQVCSQVEGAMSAPQKEEP